MSGDDCIFCKIAAGKIPAKMVFEDNEVVAFDDVNPQAPIHVMVIPKAHIEKISDISERHAALIGRLVLVAKNIAKERKIQESGYRIVMNCNKDAGQAVFHLHLHLLGGRKFSWPPG